MRLVDLKMVLATLLTVVLGRGQAPTRCVALADSAVAGLKVGPSAVVPFAARLNRLCHDDFQALFRAGRAINRAAKFEEAQSDFRLREAAAALLDRAVQLQPKNAAAWFEYGLAVKKRGGLQVDAYRAINHALDVADQFPDSTPPSLLAEIQLERARQLQDWIDRFRWLRRPAAASVGTPACSNLGLFCENYTRPGAFNQHLIEAPPVPVDVASAALHSGHCHIDRVRVGGGRAGRAMLAWQDKCGPAARSPQITRAWQPAGAR